MYWNPKKTELMCMCVGSIKNDVIANYTLCGRVKLGSALV